eukprot:m.246513 g.246513  ORF g.246513 m.246513 type:complete len:210 (+) comp15060_c0_seq1:41-670(+)
MLHEMGSCHATRIADSVCGVSRPGCICYNMTFHLRDRPVEETSTSYCDAFPFYTGIAMMVLGAVLLLVWLYLSRRRMLSAANAVPVYAAPTLPVHAESTPYHLHERQPLVQSSEPTGAPVAWRVTQGFALQAFPGFAILILGLITFLMSVVPVELVDVGSDISCSWADGTWQLVTAIVALNLMFIPLLCYGCFLVLRKLCSFCCSCCRH